MKKIYVFYGFYACMHHFELYIKYRIISVYSIVISFYKVMKLALVGFISFIVHL